MECSLPSAFWFPLTLPPPPKRLEVWFLFPPLGCSKRQLSVTGLSQSVCRSWLDARTDAARSEKSYYPLPNLQLPCKKNLQTAIARVEM
jgi:hypothetical protein